MELESDVRLLASPGARVVIGSRGWPLLGAAVLGFGVGFGVGLAIGIRTRRRGGAGAGHGLEHGRWREATRVPMRLPSDNPDVETEL